MVNKASLHNGKQPSVCVEQNHAILTHVETLIAEIVSGWIATRAENVRGMEGLHDEATKKGEQNVSRC
jgi:hypothetical protein